MRRSIEQQIESWALAPANRPLLVKGARRVGKTFTIEEVGKRIAKDGFVKLDFQTDLQLVSSLFDGPTDDVDRIVANMADYKRTPIRKESALIFLDEVQLCERALNSLRFFSGSGWRVIASGSQLGVATGNRTLPFPSGVEQITLHPMTFEEFLWALGEDQMSAAIRSHSESLLPYPAHREALSLFRVYQVLGGMPAVVARYVQTGSLDEARIQQREIDETYTADMSDPENGISGIAARRIWQAIPSQLLRSSTKKFKYSEVERGGRRAKLLEPLEWLAGAGIITVNDLTKRTEAPLAPHNEEDGSFFKVYMADTGIMFYKFQVNPRLWLEAESGAGLPVSSDFKGALAENAAMQALIANDLATYYWVPPSSWGARGELDFLLQDNRGGVIPVEVKSARNVRAKTLSAFMEHARSPYAIILSESDFGTTGSPAGAQVRHLPLYAAYCLGEECAKR